MVHLGWFCAGLAAGVLLQIIICLVLGRREAEREQARRMLAWLDGKVKEAEGR